MNRVFAISIRYAPGQFRNDYQVIAPTASRAIRMALARAKSDGLTRPHAVSGLTDHGTALEAPKPIPLIRRARGRR